MYAHLLSGFYLPLMLELWPIPYGLLFWGIYLWTRRGEHRVCGRSSSRENCEFDKGSWRFIDYGSKISRMAALVAAFVTSPLANGGMRVAVYAAGLLFMIAGTLIRRYCFRVLGDNFTFSVNVSPDQAIVQTGIYNWARHPSYTGGMLYNIGIGLALTNWISTLFLVIGMSVVYAYRVPLEEKALLRVHGDVYKEYMNRTKRFVPFLF